MRFSIIALATPLLLAARFVLQFLNRDFLLLIRKTCFSVMAGTNCKCQDANGQYNTATELCCSQNTIFSIYHDDQVHQVRPTSHLIFYLFHSILTFYSVPTPLVDSTTVRSWTVVSVRATAAPSAGPKLWQLAAHAVVLAIETVWALGRKSSHMHCVLVGVLYYYM